MMSNIKKYPTYLFLGLILMLIVNLSKDIWRLYQADERVKEAGQQLKDLQLENKALKDQEKQKENSFLLEAQIRDQLGMTKPGEVVVILPEELQNGVDDESEKAKEQKVSNWQKWLQLFWYIP